MYKDLTDKHRQDVDNFPMIFAFSNEQLAEGIKKLGASSTDELMSIGAGGIIKKADENAYIGMVERHNLELLEALEDDLFLKDAISYELANHECFYTKEFTDAFDALGISYKDKRALAVVEKYGFYVNAEEN